MSLSYAAVADAGRVGFDENPNLANSDALACGEKVWNAAPLISANVAVAEKFEVKTGLVAQESGCGRVTAYQRDELLLMRQRMTNSSESGSLGFSSRSVCANLGDETRARSVRKHKSKRSSCGTAEDDDENKGELDQIMNPAAPEFVPRCIPRIGQGKALHPRRPVQDGASVRKHAGNILTANAKEFVPLQGSARSTPGLSARDIEFILNPSRPHPKPSVPVPAFSASTPEFIPQSEGLDDTHASRESALNAGAFEFRPESMQDKERQSKPDHAISEQGTQLNAAAAEFVPEKGRLHSDSSDSESFLSAAAPEFVPSILAAPTKPVSVRDLAVQFSSPVLGC